MIPRINPRTFIKARASNKHPEQFSELNPADLADHHLIMIGDDTGVAVSPSGEICNLFRNDPAQRGAGAECLALAIGNGGRYLDCYDGPLVRYYRQFGFIESARMPFDPRFAHDGLVGAPDVVFMSWLGYPGDDPAAAIERIRRRSYLPFPLTDWKQAKDLSRFAARNHVIGRAA